VDSPARFARTFILNTWLHHENYAYSEAVAGWRSAATNPEQLGGDMPTGRIVHMSMRRPHPDARAVDVFAAPFNGFDSKAGARAFPAMLPFAEPVTGGAVEQQRCHEVLLAWQGCPIHVIFSDADPIFSFEAGERWAAQIPNATIDRIEGAGHFLQYDAPDDCLAAIAKHVGHTI
jgi:haloalkane dehalogenase